MTDGPDAASGGSWGDTYAAHFPPKGRRTGRFERGVGFDGYDRGTGVEVPKHPRLKRPGEAEPAADPFAEEEEAKAEEDAEARA